MVEDEKIIDMYWARNEAAITETDSKYGKYCRYISYNILYNEEDSMECVNDTYLRAWNAMPPKRPNKLSAFLGKIVRNLSLNLYEKRHAAKRGDGQMEVVLDELSECIPDKHKVEDVIEERTITKVINDFLANVPEEKRKIFVRRYWYMSSVNEIATEYGISQSKVKMTLLRLRNDLKMHLEKEGIFV